MVISNKETKMLGDQHSNRINILEIKFLIGKKLGNPRAEKYFGLLEGFFSRKLAKSEFDKLCIAAIGRENICLHNRLIKSILKNACVAKTPPPKGNKSERPVLDKVANEKPVLDKVANGYQRSCLQSLCRDVMPLSPGIGRKPGFRDRKSKDRPSPLGPYGKPNAVACEDLGQKTLEQQSATELLSLGSRPIEVNSVEDGEEVDQAPISPGINSWSPVTPPLGIPWNGKGNRKLLSSTVNVETCQVNGELPNTSSLRKRLEQKLEKEDMKISLDCVNVLNNGLDTFLKRLIKPSLEFASSRIENKQPKIGGHSPLVSPVSLLDFRTAMELNPQVLGEDWSIQRERVCLREFESRVSD
ncbi:Major inner capsid protein VP3 [Bienertia sinuspersici]